MEIAPVEEWLVISGLVLQLVLVGKALVPKPGGGCRTAEGPVGVCWECYWYFYRLCQWSPWQRFVLIHPLDLPHVAWKSLQTKSAWDFSCISIQSPWGRYVERHTLTFVRSRPTEMKLCFLDRQPYYL